MLILVWATQFPRMDRRIYKATICLFLEEDAVRDDNKVLMEVDANVALIVGELQGILLI
jgi:hypothetical protein